MVHCPRACYLSCQQEPTWGPRSHEKLKNLDNFVAMKFNLFSRLLLPF